MVTEKKEKLETPEYQGCLDLNKQKSDLTMVELLAKMAKTEHDVDRLYLLTHMRKLCSRQEHVKIEASTELIELLKKTLYIEDKNEVRNCQKLEALWIINNLLYDDESLIETFIMPLNMLLC